MIDTLELNTCISVETEYVLEALNHIRGSQIFAKIFPSNSCNGTELHIAINKNDFEEAMLVLKKNKIEVIGYKFYEKNIIGAFYENTGH
ncbi:MAG: hypothetical protein U9O65_08905 [Thermotogota bacterium]|nr:hypothetical protein [Thermotogota bacterium]